MPVPVHSRAPLWLKSSRSKFLESADCSLELLHGGVLLQLK